MPPQPDPQRPEIQAAMRRLEEMMHAALDDSMMIGVTPENVITWNLMTADSADRIIRRQLDEAWVNDEILDWDYDSLYDPWTETLHARISVVLPPPPQFIRINLAGPGE